jgi:IclR family transcriptional regulator, KDG regulon repressor
MEKTVTKAFRLLEALSESDRPVGISELARDLGMTKSNVFRLLNTLMKLGYLRRTRDQALYEPTLRLWAMGLKVVNRMDLKKVSEPFLQELVDETGESVHLSILDEQGVVFINKVEGKSPVRAYSRIGDRPPAWCTGTGKALLSYLSHDEVRSYCPELIRYTSKTITDYDKLFKELDAIRRQGYSVNFGEWRDSVRGVAAAILESTGKAVAAIGVSGPAERLKSADIRRHAQKVVACAAMISEALGYKPATIAVQRRVPPPPGAVASRLREHPALPRKAG